MSSPCCPSMKSAGANDASSTTTESSPPPALISRPTSGVESVSGEKVAFRLSIRMVPGAGLVSRMESSPAVAWNDNVSIVAVLTTVSLSAVSVTAPRMPASDTASVSSPPSSVSGARSESPAATSIESLPPSPWIASVPDGLSNVISWPLTSSRSREPTAASCSESPPAVPSKMTF